MVIKSFDEYNRLAAVTDTDLGSETLNINHYVFGMSTELWEAYLFRDRLNLNEEIGDFLWYAARYVYLRELHPAINTVEIHFLNEEVHEKKTIETIKSNLLEAMNILMQIVDMEKKTMAYGKEFDSAKASTHMAHIITILCSVSDYGIRSLCEANIMKLKSRFGERFSSANAIYRNTDTENEILKNKLL